MQVTDEQRRHGPWKMGIRAKSRLGRAEMPMLLVWLMVVMAKVKLPVAITEVSVGQHFCGAP